MTLVPLDTVFPIPQFHVMIITLALMTGVIMNLDANTTKPTVMIRTHVPMTLVMNILVVSTPLFLLMITMNAPTIIAALLTEFTTLINQFLHMMLV
jgi:hypothetical protein